MAGPILKATVLSKHNKCHHKEVNEYLEKQRHDGVRRGGAMATGTPQGPVGRLSLIPPTVWAPKIQEDERRQMRKEGIWKAATKKRKKELRGGKWVYSWKRVRLGVIIKDQPRL